MKGRKRERAGRSTEAETAKEEEAQYKRKDIGMLVYLDKPTLSRVGRNLDSEGGHRSLALEVMRTPSLVHTYLRSTAWKAQQEPAPDCPADLLISLVPSSYTSLLAIVQTQVSFRFKTFACIFPFEAPQPSHSHGCLPYFAYLTRTFLALSSAEVASQHPNPLTLLYSCS